MAGAPHPVVLNTYYLLLSGQWFPPIPVEQLISTACLSTGNTPDWILKRFDIGVDGQLSLQATKVVDCPDSDEVAAPVTTSHDNLNTYIVFSTLEVSIASPVPSVI